MNWTKNLATSLVFLALASCTLPAGEYPVPAEQVGKYQTVSALLTETAPVEADPSATNTPSEGTAPAPTLSAGTPPVELPTATRLAWPTHSPTADPVPCDLAQAGRPIDVTIPDNTRLEPGMSFSKTWRLVNTGTCTWDKRYALVWFSGADLGVNHVQPFSEAVPPGGSAEFTIEMAAPSAPGLYQSNWKLRNGQGQMFGIGPEGNAPFWVRIEVLPVDTPTVQPPTDLPTPTLTFTPVPVVQGIVILSPLLGFDLDGVATGEAGAIDLLLDWPETQPGSLAPQNGALWLPFDASQEGSAQCGSEPVQEKDSQAPLPLDQLVVGFQTCLRSDQGRPARLLIQAIDPVTYEVTVEYTLWKVP